MREISVTTINNESPYLGEVKKLWRRNSEVLGFFPEGAFDEHAVNRCILVASHPEEDFLGYLLYRIVRRGTVWPIAVIVHLCVSDEHREKGVARRLVDDLRRITRETFLRIELRCRRDFTANKMWPNLDFTYSSEEIGRAGFPVERWFMSFRELPLLAILQQHHFKKRFVSVIDSNVFYRLQDGIPPGSPADILLYEETMALQEDWLSDDVALSLTDETFNEIERNNDPNERQRRLSFASQFIRLCPPLEAQNAVYQRLKKHFVEYLTDNNRSDIKQISHAISGKAYAFITQDNALLRKSPTIEREFEIKVMSPGEFVGHVDDIIRDVQYSPTSLAGSRRLTKSILFGRLSSNIYDQFRDTIASERKTHFDGRLRTYKAQPSRYKLELCSRSKDEHLSLMVQDIDNHSELVIPMLRISNTPIAETVLRYNLRQIVMASFHDKRYIIRITDQSCNQKFTEAFEEVGFTKMGTEWIKCNFSFIGSSKDLLRQLDMQTSNNELVQMMFRTFSKALSNAMQAQDPIALTDIEHRLWPGKILDAHIFNYVIPIKSGWAQHLFDEELATQTLWGAKEETALKHENVYYRRYTSATQIKTPARILWYVTKDGRHHNSMHVKACSFLDEVVIGKAKDLYKKFQRLGIYQWYDILKTARNDQDKNIMALRFSNTEVFRHPISLQNYSETVKKVDNKKPCLRSPQGISVKAFSTLYKCGMEIE